MGRGHPPETLARPHPGLNWSEISSGPSVSAQAGQRVLRCSGAAVSRDKPVQVLRDVSRLGPSKKTVRWNNKPLSRLRLRVRLRS